MTVSTHTTNRQVVHASTLAELVTATGIHTAMLATVDDNGSGKPAEYGIFPLGTLPVNSPHVVNSTACPVQFIDGYAQLGIGTISSTLTTLTNATFLTDSDESATLPYSRQLSIFSGDPNNGILVDNPSPGVWDINAPFGTTAGTYMQGNDSRVAPAWYQVGGDIHPARITLGRGIQFDYDSVTHSLAIGTSFPVVSWYATVDGSGTPITPQDVLPARISNNAGIQIGWDSVTSTAYIQTSFTPPAGPTPSWFASNDGLSHYPVHLTNNTGIEFVWDSVTNSVAIQTNFTPPSNPTTTKVGTHRVHSYHDEKAFVPSVAGVTYSYPESTWKGDTVDPNSATWITRALITVRVQAIDTVSSIPIDKTRVVQIYKQRVGGTWSLGDSTYKDALGTESGTLTIGVLLSGTGNRTIDITVAQAPAPSNASDCVMFVTIDGGGNYAT